jgi:hypothetical protein
MFDGLGYNRAGEDTRSVRSDSEPQAVSYRSSESDNLVIRFHDSDSDNPGTINIDIPSQDSNSTININTPSHSLGSSSSGPRSSRSQGSGSDNPGTPSQSSDGTIEVDGRDGNAVFFDEGDGYLLVKRVGTANNQTMIVRNIQNGRLYFRKRIHGDGNDREFYFTRQLDAHLAMSHIVHPEWYGPNSNITNDCAFIFSYCNGGSLQTLLNDYRRERRVIPEVFVWHAIKQLITAVAYMHTGWQRGMENPPDNMRPIAHKGLSADNILLNYATPWPKCLPDLLIGDFHLAVEIDDNMMQGVNLSEPNDSDQENVTPDSDQENITPNLPDKQLHPNMVSDMRALLRIILSLINFSHNPASDPNTNSQYCPASYSQDLRTLFQNFWAITFNQAVQPPHPPIPVPRAMDLVRRVDGIAWMNLHRLMPRYKEANAVRKVHTSGWVVNIPLLFTEGQGQVPRWKEDQVTDLVRPWEWRDIDTMTFR